MEQHDTALPEQKTGIVKAAEGPVDEKQDGHSFSQPDC